MIKVPYVNLGYLAKQIMPELLQKTQKVIESGAYILGPEVTEFEANFAQYCGTKYAVGVSNGTSALTLVLQSIGIGPGDEVITAPNSFVASATAIALCGAKPVFADVSEDQNMDPRALEKAITPRTKAIMPVHLAGRIARMEEIMEIASAKKLFVLEDSAQSVGAASNGKRVGNWGHASSFSLHPLKNLHAFGDAGIITTNDESLYQDLRIRRNIGLKNRDECVMWATNDRLDELQAAYLNVQLRYLDQWTAERKEMARHYNEGLKGVVKVPCDFGGYKIAEENHVYQTYVVLAERRDELQKYLNERGIEAKVHYPIPIHLQECAKSLKCEANDYPMTFALSKKIMSLPLWNGMTVEQQNHVISSIREFYAR